MENCTIYSHKLDFDKVVEIVKTSLPKAKVEVKQSGIHKSLEARIKGGFFGKSKTLKLNWRQRENPSYKLTQVECALTQNLYGMVGYLQAIPPQNEVVKNQFLHKVMSINCEIGFIAEPMIYEDFEQVLRSIVQTLDGFVFASPAGIFTSSEHQHFLDKDLNLIIDAEGKCNIDELDVKVDAKYHDQDTSSYTEEQKERKTKNEAFLSSHEVKVNQNLPCMPSSEDVRLRTLDEVIGRAYALMITAVKGEGLEQEHLERAVAAKKINSFSPNEKMIYEAAELDDQTRANATWRYESLYALLWALGLMDELKYPNDICDVKTIVSKIFHPSREEFESSAQLRDVSEILDELDKTFRMNWASVDARIKNEEVSGRLNPSVVYERHYTLNWLTNHQDQDWDDVKTHT